MTDNYSGQFDLIQRSDMERTPTPSGYKGLHAFHKYWGKKPAEPMAFLVNALCPANGIVMDPFLGSGLLARISRLAKRRFIGIDINPVSIELGRLFHDLPLAKEYKQAISMISSNARPIIEDSYIRSDGSISSHYLWNGSDLLSVWTIEGRNRVEHEVTGYDLEKYRVFSDYQLAHLREITSFSNSRINATPDLDILDIFKPRACANIDILVHYILTFNDPIVRRALLLTLTAASGQMSNFVFAIDHRGKKNSQSNASSRTEVGSWVIGFWRPTRHFEVNVWNCFINRSRRLQRALDMSEAEVQGRWTDNINRFFSDGMKCALINRPAQEILRNIPDGSIDLILTDPPHGDRIPYLELSDFWNSILQFAQSEFKKEIVVSDAREREKTKDQYVRSMRGILRSFARVLKPQGLVCLLYNSRGTMNWEFLRDPPALEFRGCFHLNYSASSVVQDNRSGALKFDIALVYQRTGGGIRSVAVLENFPGWSFQFPYQR